MVPKATVKMSMPPPQPMPAPPVTASLVPVGSDGSDADEPSADPLLLPLSIGALAVSLVSLALSYLAWAA